VSLGDLHYLPLLDVSERIRRGELSPVTVLEAILDRIARLDGAARSYTTLLSDRARAAAARAEAEIRAGVWRGPLHGIPLAVKDLCATSFAPTTGGMPIRKNSTPDRDATVVRRLEDAGAVIVGKLKMTEGAYTSHHPDDPSPLNPWNTAHWVGSSSTGSGVATALGLCFGALGSDTGGSTVSPRRPAG
jgi:amidase